MPFQKTPHAAADYVTQDALFARAIRYSANQHTPNVWRKTAKRSVFTPPPSHKKAAETPY